jgi:hypothetical protein
MWSAGTVAEVVPEAGKDTLDAGSDDFGSIGKAVQDCSSSSIG